MINVSLVEWDCADLHVVNSARISFNKKSYDLSAADIGLLKFLADNDHWTPFGHVRLVMKTRSHATVRKIMGDGYHDDLLSSAGFVVHKDPDDEFYYISGSLYGWLTAAYELLLVHGDERSYNELLIILYDIAPSSVEAYYDSNQITSVKSLPKDRYSIHYVPMHEAPNSVQSMTVHVKCPVSIARQIFKSNRNTLVYNEISRRYVAVWPVIKPVRTWRGAAKNKKQGSDGVLSSLKSILAKFVYMRVRQVTLSAYKVLLLLGAAPEQARFVLPQGMEVEFYMTGTLSDLERVVKLRSDSTAQEEVQVFAHELDKAISMHHYVIDNIKYSDKI